MEKDQELEVAKNRIKELERELEDTKRELEQANTTIRHKSEHIDSLEVVNRELTDAVNNLD
jgi:chromosome segregation ATPase